MVHQGVAFVASLLGLTIAEFGVELLATLNSPNSKYVRLRDEYKVIYFGSLFVAFFALHVYFQELSDLTFIILGTLCYIRQFGSKHELMHTNELQNVALVYLLDIPCSLLHMGLGDFRTNHKMHHAANHPSNLAKPVDKQVKDPDSYMIQRHWLTCFLNSLLECEQSLIRLKINTHYEHIGHSAKVVLHRTLVLAVVGKCSGMYGFLLWLAAARMGNTFAMFFFHTLFHYEPIYKQGFTH